MLCDVSESNHTVLPFSYQDIDGPGLASYSCRRIITPPSLPSSLASWVPCSPPALGPHGAHASLFSPRTDVPVERLREWDYYPTNLSSRTPTGPMLVFETLRTSAWPGDLHSFATQTSPPPAQRCEAYAPFSTGSSRGNGEDLLLSQWPGTIMPNRLLTVSARN